MIITSPAPPRWRRRASVLSTSVGPPSIYDICCSWRGKCRSLVALSLLTWAATTLRTVGRNPTLPCRRTWAGSTLTLAALFLPALLSPDRRPRCTSQQPRLSIHPQTAAYVDERHTVSELYYLLRLSTILPVPSCVTETTPVPAFAATTSTTGPSAGLASTSGHLSLASHHSASYRHVGYVSLRLSRGSCLSTVLTCKQPSKAIGIRQDSKNVKYCATPIDSRFVSSAKCCPISVLSTEHSTLASHPPFVLLPWRPFLSKKRWISDRAH